MEGDAGLALRRVVRNGEIESKRRTPHTCYLVLRARDRIDKQAIPHSAPARRHEKKVSSAWMTGVKKEGLKRKKSPGFRSAG